jgi:hypothetical protein
LRDQTLLDLNAFLVGCFLNFVVLCCNTLRNQTHHSAHAVKHIDLANKRPEAFHCVTNQPSLIAQESFLVYKFSLNVWQQLARGFLSVLLQLETKRLELNQ